MATIKAKQTIGNKWLISMDELPTASGGVYSPLGSEALVNNAGAISMWLKTGALDTDWTMIQAGSVDLSPYLKKDGSVDITGTIKPDADGTRSFGTLSRAFSQIVSKAFVIGDTTGVQGAEISLSGSTAVWFQAVGTNRGFKFSPNGTGSIDMSSAKIINVANGLSANDAVNRSQLDTKIDSSLLGAVSGVAQLGADQKLLFSQLPAIAITDTFVVPDQASMLALSSAEQGDVAVRTDLSKSFILVSGLPSVLANWQELLSPTDTVLSVNGQTGIVNLTTTDIAEGTNYYFTEARVRSSVLTGFSNAVQTPISATDSVLQAFGKAQGQIDKEIVDRSNADDVLSDKILDNDGLVFINEATPSPVSIPANARKVFIHSSVVSNKTIVFPDITTLLVGTMFEVFNQSVATITIQDNALTQLNTMFQGSQDKLMVVNNASEGLANWAQAYGYMRNSAFAMNASNRKIINLLDPVSAQDGATKAYVDAQVGGGSNWKSSLSASALNIASADLYFGTFSGDYDIQFFRNNEKYMAFEKNGLDKVIKVDAKDISFSALGRIRSLTSDLHIASLAGNLIQFAQGTLSQDFNVRQMYQSNAGVPKIANNKMFSEGSYVSGTTLNASLTLNLAGSRNRMVMVTFLIQTDIGDCAFRKVIHIDRNDTLQISQDDFTSKASSASTIECVVASYTSSVLTLAVSGLIGVMSGAWKLSVDEIAHFQ